MFRSVCFQELDKITDQLDDIPEAEKPDKLDTGSKHYLKSIKELIELQVYIVFCTKMSIFKWNICKLCT